MWSYPFHEACEIAAHGPGATSGGGKVAGYSRHLHPVGVEEAGVAPGLRKELEGIVNEVVVEGAGRLVALHHHVVPLDDVAVGLGILHNNISLV